MANPNSDRRGEKEAALGLRKIECKRVFFILIMNITGAS